jgi:methionine-rich copper-binding protein CopC
VLRRCSAVLALLVLVVSGLALPASAHTQVRAASPAPGETVTGTVDRVVIEFLDPVMPTPQIEVIGPDGEPVDGLGETEQTADDVAEVTFDPLFEVGRYQVTYEYASLDGFPQEGSHEFTFEEGGTGGTAGVRLAIAGVVALIVAGFVVAALRARRRSATS